MNEREAIEWLGKAIADREAGVQRDLAHLRRSGDHEEVDHARSFATIGGMKLSVAMTLYAMLTRGDHMKEQPDG